MHRFSRTEMLIGSQGLQTLQNSAVAVFGVGGVGSFAVEALARAGIGQLTLIDHDVVSLTNLNRQLPALSSTIGLPKAAVLKERILDINPDCQVEVILEAYGEEKGDWLRPERWNFIVDAIDSMDAKIDLLVRAHRLGIPIVSSMGAGNKLDPTQFEVADIYATSVCPLARVMRKELKVRGVKSLKVVYSREKPLKSTQGCGSACICPPGSANHCDARRAVPGSISFVPSVVGLIIAGEVIKDLTRAGR